MEQDYSDLFKQVVPDRYHIVANHCLVLSLSNNMRTCLQSRSLTMITTEVKKIYIFYRDKLEAGIIVCYHYNKYRDFWYL